jgi:hypothetical protein
MRKVRITSSVQFVLSLGDYQSVRIGKELEAEVEVNSKDELKEKSRKLDEICAKLMGLELDVVAEVHGLNLRSKLPAKPGAPKPAAANMLPKHVKQEDVDNILQDTLCGPPGVHPDDEGFEI